MTGGTTVKNTVRIVTTSLILAASACGESSTPAPTEPSKPAQGLNVLTQGTEAAQNQAPAQQTAPTGTETPAQPSGATEDASEIAYAYSPIGKRDPFRSLFDQLRREEQAAQVTELQTFELDQLKLVAIVSRIATPYAMVEDPNAKGHTLSRGTLIGKNWGRVSEINPTCVVVKEEYRDYTGRKVTNKPTICLPKPEDLKLD
jgi:type IV pilus assembly protein PilP